MTYRNELLLFPLSLLLVACSTSPIYVNPSMQDNSRMERKAALLKADGICAGAASGVELPQIQYNQNPRAGFAGGLANGYNMAGAIAASQEKDRIYVGCMASQGWFLAKDKEEVKELLDTYKADQADKERQSLDAVRNAIENTEHLRDWFHNKDEKEKLEYAINLDDAIKDKPTWKHRTLEDRFKFVTNMTIMHFNEIKYKTTTN